MKKDLIFLGGTVGKNPWRLDFIKQLLNLGFTAEQIFNPVVADWNDTAAAAEEEAKKEATYFIYFIGNPMQPGNPLSAYSMVEASMALYDQQERTVVIFDQGGMESDDFMHARKAMKQTLNRFKERHPNANIFATLEEGLVWFEQQKG